MKGTRFYRIWQEMKKRCDNTHCKDYCNYGGKGITYCNEWKDFRNFKTDMYDSYLDHCDKQGVEQTSIDRINYIGNYCKENCRWATPLIQSNNRSYNRVIEFNGESKNISQWALITGISKGVIRYRLDQGWDTIDILTKPPMEVTKITYEDQTHTLSEWSVIKNISKITIQTRLNRGWNIDRVFSEVK